jgi:hypothetical protein
MDSPFVFALTLHNGNGSPGAATEATWVTALPLVQAVSNQVVVLSGTEGVQTQGMYVYDTSIAQPRWRLVLPYPAVCQAIIEGSTLDIFYGVTEPSTGLSPSAQLWRNSLPFSGTEFTVNDSAVWAGATVSASSGGVSSVSGQTGAVVVEASDNNPASGSSLIANSGATTGNIKLRTIVSGSGITVSSDTNGNIEISGANQYVLPVATASVLGGVKQGTGVSIAGDGTISVPVYASLASPAFTGTPTAPTPTAGDTTTKIATTAFVQSAISTMVAGVSSFNTRTGAVVLAAADVTGVGGALLVSPAFTGTPTAPTATAGTSTTQLATTAFVGTALGSYAPLASPALTGTPTAPTVSSSSDNSTKIATTAFVQTLISTVANGLNYKGTWDANANNPTLASGVGTNGEFYKVSVAGSTNLDGNSTWAVGDIAIFAGTAWSRIPAQSSEVLSFNTRTGAVVLNSTDVTTALGFTPANATSVAGLAPIASPAFTGTPTAPTPTAGDNSTKVATTAFVASYAPLASPALTGVPTAPTATVGTNTTQIATTAFVISSMGTYAPVNNPSFTGTPVAPTATAGTSTTQIATTAFVATALGSYAPIASPVFTGRAQSPAYSFRVDDDDHGGNDPGVHEHTSCK